MVWADRMEDKCSEGTAAFMSTAVYMSTAVEQEGVAPAVLWHSRIPAAHNNNSIFQRSQQRGF